MSLTLHPKYAVPGKLRVWLGLTNHNAPAAPMWDLAPVDPSVPAPAQTVPVSLRELSVVRPPALVQGDPPRVCAGLYEFSGLQPGAAYDIRVTVAGEETTLRARSLPEALPAGPDEWFNLLLVSCYHYFEASPAEVENAINRAREECDGFGGHRGEFHLSVLMGDQVYLDLPTLQDFPNDPQWLAAKFEDDYRRNWFGEASQVRAGRQVTTGYAHVLAAAPSVCLPDDHEYWNNFPHVSPFIGNSWSATGRDHWREAARALFAGFQLQEPAQLGRPVFVDLPPLSLCIADSRTFRATQFQASVPGANPFENSLPPGVLAEVEEWVAATNAAGQFGVFVTGQSLLSEPAGGLAKHVGDAELANYQDYPPLMQALTALRNPALYVTGDVHWGRLVELKDPLRANTTSAYELITSPCALVTTVGSDDLARAWGAFKSWFGARDPWPRHNAASVAGSKFRPYDGRVFHADTLHRQTGDQFAVLSLQRMGEGANQWVNARLRFYPIHADPKVRAKFFFEQTLKLQAPA